MKHFITATDVSHGSFPWCTVEWMSNPELVGARELLLVRATFPAGEAHNFHKHPAREEKRLLKTGEMAHIPANVPHMTYNPGPDVLKFLAILSPVEAEGEFTIDVFNEEPWKTLFPPLPY